MTTATLTSPRHQELINIMTRAGKPLTSKQLFAEAKGFECQDDVSKTLNYLLKKGAVERELYAQNAYSYWPATQANATDDSGNTLLRIGEDDPMPASPVRAVINDALKPCPEIDAVTQEMANQAEIAYQVLSEALGMTPEQMSDLTLAGLAEQASKRLQGQRIDFIGPDAIESRAELIANVVRSSQADLLGKICHMLDISLYSTSTEILAEVENLSRLAGRATHAPAKPVPSGPYIIISDPRGAAGTYETIDEARKFAESTARRSTSGRAAIVNIVAEVAMVPQWSGEA